MYVYIYIFLLRYFLKITEWFYGAVIFGIVALPLLCFISHPFPFCDLFSAASLPLLNPCSGPGCLRVMFITKHQSCLKIRRLYLRFQVLCTRTCVHSSRQICRKHQRNPSRYWASPTASWRCPSARCLNYPSSSLMLSARWREVAQTRVPSERPSKLLSALNTVPHCWSFFTAL